MGRLTFAGSVDPPWSPLSLSSESARARFAPLREVERYALGWIDRSGPRDPVDCREERVDIWVLVGRTGS